MAKIKKQFGLVFSPTGFIISYDDVEDGLNTNNLIEKGFSEYPISTPFSKAYYKVSVEGDRTADQLKTSMAWERSIILEKVLTDILGFKKANDIFLSCISFYSATNEEVYSVYSNGQAAILFYTRIDKNTIVGEREYMGVTERLIL